VFYFFHSINTFKKKKGFRAAFFQAMFTDNQNDKQTRCRCSKEVASHLKSTKLLLRANLDVAKVKKR